MSVQLGLFDLRAGERIWLVHPLDPTGHRFAVRLEPVGALPEPAAPHATAGACEGQPVSALAVLGAQRLRDGWNWMQMHPRTKEEIGKAIESMPEHRVGEWYGLVITQDAGGRT